MRVALLTREYPPEVYGGAGVHVEHLARELAQLVEVRVHCFGAPRESTLVERAYRPWEALAGDGAGTAALEAMSVDLAMAGAARGIDVVHSHTWYTNLGGHLASLLHGIPHVMTLHSLEPLRPWKQEQLGGGYALSSFCERTAVEAADAVVAVSEAMRRDVRACYPGVDSGRITVVHNGVDTDAYRPVSGTEVLRRLGADESRPAVVFIGRITQQKGIMPLLAATEGLPDRAQLILCAAAPDTPAIAAEVAAAVSRLREAGRAVLWVERPLERAEAVQLLSCAAVAVCPSVYEPFGLVNLEAMACGAAVVASDVGGIPEIVLDGETGWLVPCAAVGGVFASAGDEAAFVVALAARVGALLDDPALAARMGAAGRRRAVEVFGWKRIAERTVDVYEDALKRRAQRGGNAVDPSPRSAMGT